MVSVVRSVTIPPAMNLPRAVRIAVGAAVWAAAAVLAAVHLAPSGEGARAEGEPGADLASYFFGRRFPIVLRFTEDVEIAVEQDGSRTVPVLATDGAFRAVGP